MLKVPAGMGIIMNDTLVPGIFCSYFIKPFTESPCAKTLPLVIGHKKSKIAVIFFSISRQAFFDEDRELMKQKLF